ncbi:MAG TPA: hypothetical protein VEI97_01805, partial [bacterium]|nr:hypothetical protein [bacterium]
YNGSAFQGWQRQPDGRPTVQATLEEALATLAGHPVPTVGASRTDRGVHALGQVVHATTSRWYPEGSWRARLNSLLPATIRVRAWALAPWDFHARYRAAGKTYAYDFAWGDAPPVLAQGSLLPFRLRRAPDPALLQAGVRAFRHQELWDSFTSEADPIARRLTGSWLVTGPGRARIVLQGPGFHYQQVRRMARALADLATGEVTTGAFDALLANPRRNAQEQPAPAAALVLVAVHYDPKELGSLHPEALAGWWWDPRANEVTEP